MNEHQKAASFAYTLMEPDVCDLDRMGEITERLVAEWVDDRENVRALELANFAVQHLRDMLKQFKANYDNRSWKLFEEARQ